MDQGKFPMGASMPVTDLYRRKHKTDSKSLRLPRYLPSITFSFEHQKLNVNPSLQSRKRVQLNSLTMAFDYYCVALPTKRTSRFVSMCESWFVIIKHSHTPSSLSKLLRERFQCATCRKTLPEVDLWMLRCNTWQAKDFLQERNPLRVVWQSMFSLP